MSNSVKQESPLVQIDLSALTTKPECLSISEVPFSAYVNVRGRVDNAAFVQAFEGVLGGQLPQQNNTFAVYESSLYGELTVLWFGPDEWLLVIEQGKELALVEKLRTEFADLFAAVTDLSGGYTSVSISGSAATDLLRKGCTIDLHHSVFSSGQCAQTLLGKTGVAIYKTSDAPDYTIIVRRSFSDYLGLWLLDASREFEILSHA